MTPSHWREALALRLYSLGVWAAQPLLRRKLRRRAVQEPGYAEAVPERFGCYAAPATPTPPLWIHAVSLGESRAAGILLREIRQQQPSLPVLLTHGTATGRTEGQRLLADIGMAGDQQAWLPWDTPAAVARFLQHFRPRMGVLMETEVWPNLVHACQAANVPLWLVNARLNEKSFTGARRLPSLLPPAYRDLTGVLAQTEADGQRLQTLGANVLGITGNLKFDEQPAPALLQQGQHWRSLNAGGHGKPVVALASSREGEEALWLDAIHRLPDPRRVQWLLIPRHPQRFDEVAELVQGRGLTLSRRSQWQADQPLPTADVWLGDSMGEMPLYYRLADVALMGASFAPLGGQNLIEACACGCPVIVGPHTFNFAQAAEDAIAAGAAERAPDMQQAIHRALRLVQDAAMRTASRVSAQQFATAKGGAARATARRLLSALR